MTIEDELDELIATYMGHKEELIREREVINGKLTAVGEFLSDLQGLKFKVEQKGA